MSALVRETISCESVRISCERSTHKLRIRKRADLNGKKSPVELTRGFSRVRLLKTYSDDCILPFQ